MAKSIGTLGVEVTANDAELRAAMKRAADATVGAFGQMEAAAGKFSSLLTRFAVAGAGIGIVTNSLEKLSDAINQLDSLNDLSKRTAISVEALGGFKIIADQSGVSLEDLANGVKRLTKAQIAAADGDEKMQSLLKILGVTAREPEQALIQLAKAFEGLDDQSRVEVATRLGKGFDKLIPLLSEGSEKLAKMADTAARLNPVTKESADQADKFNDALVELKAISSATWTQLASEALPALNNIVRAMFEARKESGLLMAAIVGVGGVFTAVFTDDNLTPLQKTQKELAEVNTQIALQKQRLQDASGIAGKYGDNLRAAISAGLQAANVRKTLLESSLNKPANPVDGGTNGGSSIGQQLCESTGGKWNSKTGTCDRTGGANDTAKQALDNQMKTLDRAAQQARDTLSSVYKDIDQLNRDNVISFRDYYDARNALQTQAVQKELDLFDQQIKAQEDFKRYTTNPKEKIEADGKIAAILERKETLVRNSAEAVKQGNRDEKKAFEDLDNQIKLINASVLEFTGNLEAAAKIRIDVANAPIRTRLNTEGRSGAVDDLALKEAQELAQARLNQLGIDAGIIADRRANAESALNILQQNGGISELTSLAARSEARRNEIAQLEVIYQSRLKIAQESNNPRLLQDADNLRAKIDELRASSNLLEQAFDRIFVGSAADAFASFISGAKSAKDAFKDFTNSVISQISRLAAQDLANSLFKGGGTEGGGLFGFLSSFFGGSGGAASANAGGGFDPSLLGFAKGGVFGGNVIKFANGGSFTNSVVDRPTRFRFANGSKFGEMGEAGAEAIMPLARDARGRLGVRGGGGGGGTVQHINVNISTPDANSFRQSEGQIAAQMAAMIARGGRNR